MFYQLKIFLKIQAKKETNNPLCHYVYDADYEKIRKYHLEKFIMRPKEKNEEEKNLLEELKKIEQVLHFQVFRKINILNLKKIKKEEKEQMSLQKILKIDVKEEDSEFENREDELNFKKLNEV